MLPLLIVSRRFHRGTMVAPSCPWLSILQLFGLMTGWWYPYDFENLLPNIRKNMGYRSIYKYNCTYIYIIIIMIMIILIIIFIIITIIIIVIIIKIIVIIIVIIIIILNIYIYMYIIYIYICTHGTASSYLTINRFHYRLHGNLRSEICRHLELWLPQTLNSLHVRLHLKCPTYQCWESEMLEISGVTFSCQKQVAEFYGLWKI